MPGSSRNQGLLDAIVDIAESIARSSPECADRAMLIVRLVGDLERAMPDPAMVEDALEASSDGEMSDGQIRKATSSVIKAMRER